MKRFIAFLCFVFLVGLPIVSFAQGSVGLPNFPNPTDFNLNSDDIKPVDGFTLEKGIQLVALVLKVTYIIFFIIAAFMIVLTAWDYLQSNGDASGVKKAQQRLIYIAVAIAVALVSLGIDNFVRNILERK